MFVNTSVLSVYSGSKFQRVRGAGFDTFLAFCSYRKNIILCIERNLAGQLPVAGIRRFANKAVVIIHAKSTDVAFQRAVILPGESNHAYAKKIRGVCRADAEHILGFCLRAVKQDRGHGKLHGIVY